MRLTALVEEGCVDWRAGVETVEELGELDSTMATVRLADDGAALDVKLANSAVVPCRR